MYLAFYKDKGTFFDFLIRIFTFSKYSHVEFTDLNYYYTSSPRDRGVVKRKIQYNPDHWDLVRVDVQSKEVEAFYNKTSGAGYDYMGILLSQIFPFNLHDTRKWFCSEWCGEVMGFRDSHRLSPQTLYKNVKK